MAVQAPEHPVTGVPVTGVVLAQSSRQTQLEIRAELLALVAQLWPDLNLENPATSWPRWLGDMTTLLDRFHQELAREAATLYRGIRQLELGDPGSAVLADLPAEEWLTKALGYAAPGVYEIKRRAGLEPAQASDAALTQTLGVSSRIAMDGARTTTIDSAAADVVRVGWYRVTDGDPCAFCALMASRGAVYRSAESAGQENDWHNDCGCTVASTFLRKKVTTGIGHEAAGIYQSVAHLPNPERLPAFRKAWASRPRTAAAAA